jgi:hypothetical protein
VGWEERSLARYDSLALANNLTEQVGPEMAQPRFLRIVERIDK